MIVRCSAGTVGCTDQGEGMPPLVLLHGFPLDRTIWHEQFAGLGGRRLVAPDLRGFGDSPASAGPYTIDDLADDVVALLDHLAIETAVVAGLSMGGYVALALAEHHRERLAGLVLISSRAGADDAAVRAGRGEAIRVIASSGGRPVVRGMFDRLWAPATPAAVRSAVATQAEAVSATALVHALMAMRDRPDREPLLPRLGGLPTLVLTGAADTMIDPAASRAMAEAIPGAELVVVEGAGHLPQIERPVEVNRALEAFLRQRV
jgi:3-oxoadipate enol-lactonase